MGLNRRQDPIGEIDIVGDVLLGVRAGDFAILLVHKLRQADLAALDRAFERR